MSSRAIVMQRKTQRPVWFEITEATREAISAWVTRLICARPRTSFQAGASNDICRAPVQAAIEGLGGVHRARTEQVWDALAPAHQGDSDLQAHQDMRVIQLLLGHTKLESTVRYLGMEVDNALEISEQTEI